MNRNARLSTSKRDADLPPTPFAPRIGVEASALAQVDILRDLTPAQRALVASLGEEMVLPADYILGTHGSKGDTLYLILEGEVELSVPTVMDYLAVRVVKGGESVPLSVLVGDSTLITTAVAMTSTRVVMIPRQRLLALCDVRPEIASVIFRSIAGILAQRYRFTLAKLTDTPGDAVRYADLWTNL